MKTQGRLIHEADALRDVLKAAPDYTPCRSVLMADPAHFSVEYAINPWMQDETGRLKQVETALAREQWEALKTAYESVGVPVRVIAAPEDKRLPDFCFAANQSLAFADENGAPHVILARMANPDRDDEVAFYREWYERQGYTVHELSKRAKPFEGTGDAIWLRDKHVLFGGIGLRTSEVAWQEVADIVGVPVVPLRLVDERFYHLDTCLSVMSAETALWLPDAFDEASQELLRATFQNLIEVDDEDAAGFACNAHCPDGVHLLIQHGLSRTHQALQDHGFKVIELGTGEFMKSGGSVFCLKQELPL